MFALTFLSVRTCTDWIDSVLGKIKLTDITELKSVFKAIQKGTSLQLKVTPIKQQLMDVDTFLNR